MFLSLQMEGNIYAVTSSILDGCKIGYTMKTEREIIKKYEDVYSVPNVLYFQKFENAWFVEKVFHMICGPNLAQKKSDGSPSTIYKLYEKEKIEVCMGEVLRHIKSGISSRIVELARTLTDDLVEMGSVSDSLLLQLMDIDGDTEMVEIAKKKNGVRHVAKMYEERLKYLDTYLENIDG